MTAGRLEDAAQALAAILARENDCLERLDYAGAVALASEKRRAADAFIVAQTPAPGARRDVAAEATARRLTRLADENRELLARALVVQSHVVDCFARAMPSATATPRYGARGTVAHRLASPVALVARA